MSEQYGKNLKTDFSKDGIVGSQQALPLGSDLSASLLDQALLLDGKFNTTLNETFDEQTDCNDDQITDERLLTESLSGQLPLRSTPHQMAWAVALTNGNASVTATPPVDDLHEHLITRSKKSLLPVFCLADHVEDEDTGDLQGRYYPALVATGYTLNINKNALVKFSLNTVGLPFVDLPDGYTEKPCISVPGTYADECKIIIGGNDVSEKFDSLNFGDNTNNIIGYRGTGTKPKKFITGKRRYDFSIGLAVGIDHPVVQAAINKQTVSVLIQCGLDDQEHVIWTLKKVKLKTNGVRDYIGAEELIGYTVTGTVLRDTTDDETPSKVNPWLEKSTPFLLLD